MSFLPNMQLVLDSLGWAVLHSLWQGALAALLVWGFRSLSREKAADGRYLFGFTALCGLLAAFIGTFLYTYNTGISSAPLASTAVDTLILTNTGTQTGITTNPLMQITNFTNWIGALWILGFAGLGVRYLSAFRLTHKLRTTGLSKLPTEWDKRFTRLASKCGIPENVRGYISDHVASPITFGFWKPIVLVPAWFFTGMSSEQCEAVLLHEFAHIRRHDYLTNIVQVIIKTVFFYHPAVAYICKSINEDREHACDDFAAMMSKNPESLAIALGTIRLKAARNTGVFALGADGPDTPLMHRLKRLLGTHNKNTRTGSIRGTAAMMMILIGSTFLLTLGATQSQAHPVSEDSEKLAGAKNDHNANLNITGDGYKIVGNKYYLKKGKYYTHAQTMLDGYSYSFPTIKGTTYAVKTDDKGHAYVEVDGNWYNAKDKPKLGIASALSSTLTMNTKEHKKHTKSAYKSSKKYKYGHYKINGQSFKTKTNIAKNQTHIKIRGKWYDLDDTDLDALLPTPPVRPASPVLSAPPAHPSASWTQAEWRQNTWEHTQEQQEQAFERAEEQREAAHELTEAQREWAEEQREAANERAEEQRERVAEHAERELERAEEQREREFERAEEQRERVAEQQEHELERAEEQREASSMSATKNGEKKRRNWLRRTTRSGL